MDEKKKYFKPSKAQQWANEGAGNIMSGLGSKFFATDKIAAAKKRIVSDAGYQRRLLGRGNNYESGPADNDATSKQPYPSGDAVTMPRRHQPLVDLDSRMPNSKYPSSENTSFAPTARKLLQNPKKNGTVKSAANQGVMAPGTWHVGNMDVRFDPSVSQAARQRFLAQPTAPGTRRVAGIGMVRGPERPQERKPPETIGEMMHERWRMANERQAESRRNNMTDQALRGRALDQQFTSDQARIGLEGGRIGLDAERLDLDRQRFGAESDIARRRLETEDAATKAQVQAAQQQIRLGEFDINRQNQLAALEREYPTAGPDRQRSLRDYMAFLNQTPQESEPYKLETVPRYNEAGMQTGTDFYRYGRDGIPQLVTNVDVEALLDSDPLWQKHLSKLSPEERAQKIEQIRALSKQQ